MNRRILSVLLAISFNSSGSLAAGQWAWEAGKQSSNGAVTVKSISGSSSYTGVQNPTGAVAKINQTAVTQPPTVVVQATASLPIRKEYNETNKAATPNCHSTDPAVLNSPNSCLCTMSGTSTANEGIAITSDRTTLLTCQSEAIAGANCDAAGIGAKAVEKSGTTITYLICQ